MRRRIKKAMAMSAAASNSKSKSKSESNSNSNSMDPSSMSCCCCCSTTSTHMSTIKPSWLLSNLADVEERMKVLACKQQEDGAGDTFAERAEAYYKRRPQLLSLLEDLYNAYLTLSDRYIQTIAKNHRRSRLGNPSQMSTIYNDYYDYHDQQEEDGHGGGETLSQTDSDAGSALSYQQSNHAAAATKDDADGVLLDFDTIVTDIVMKNVEYDILADEANSTEKRYKESARKIELHKSLLEVLESERLILLNENAKLGYQVRALVEDNKAIASESLFMRRKAGELARCLLKVREDQRVCLLSRKIEDLQGQIYGLEKRNKDYYEQLVKRDQQHPVLKLALAQEEESSIHKKKKKMMMNGKQVHLEACFQIGNAGKGSSWWGRLKTMDLFLCGHYPPSA